MHDAPVNCEFKNKNMSEHAQNIFIFAHTSLNLMIVCTFVKFILIFKAHTEECIDTPLIH